jgi:hypothetical protein
MAAANASVGVCFDHWKIADAIAARLEHAACIFRQFHVFRAVELFWILWRAVNLLLKFLFTIPIDLDYTIISLSLPWD